MGRVARSRPGLLLGCPRAVLGAGGREGVSWRAEAFDNLACLWKS